MIGAIEIAYFGFFCFEPKIWPDKAPVATCNMPFTEITEVYTLMILCIMVPLRVWLQSRKDQDPERNTLIFGLMTLLHMVICLSWLIYALVSLKDTSDTCWDPFTWQYLNYYLLLLITLGPACTIGFGLLLLILCLPCICKQGI